MAPVEEALVTMPVNGPKPAVAVGEKPTSHKNEKLKKAKAAKSTKPRSTSAHPSYFEMISEAIASLKERMGSSQYAIAKFAEDKHKDKLPSNFKKMLLFQLKKLVATGKLVKIKNSFKMSGALPTPANPSAARKPGVKTVKAKLRASAPVPKKVKPAVKPKPKTIAKSKSGLKSKSSAKLNPAAKLKLKPETKVKSAKVAKTSSNPSPGKKIAAKKPKAAKASAPGKKIAAEKRKAAKASAKPSPGKKIAAKKPKVSTRTKLHR